MDRTPGRNAIPMSLVRASLEGARLRNADLAPLLRAAGLRESDIDGEGWIGADRFGRLSAAIGRTLRDEAGGFLERPIPLGSFSMMAHAAITAPNLRRALLRATRFYRLMRDDFELRLSERGEECLLTLTYPATPPPLYFTQSLFVVLLRWASWMIDANIMLNRISLRDGPPPFRTLYDGMFPGQHLFGQRHNYLAFSHHYLGKEVRQNAHSLLDFLAHAPTGLLRQHRGDVTMADRVRTRLSEMHGRTMSLKDAAAHVDASPQTLRRRLKAEGTTFQQLKDHVRRDRAVFLLLHEQAPVEKVAQQLGYSEPSTFHRAFRKWTGMAPGEYRETYQSVEGGTKSTHSST